jgi:hypothetical protein
MGGHEQETDLRDSQPGSRETGDAPGMGVSSERVGHSGPRQEAPEGVKDNSAVPDPVPDADAPPEQREGLPEPQPDNDVPAHPLHHKNPGHSHG